jgi:hypothetical protein
MKSQKITVQLKIMKSHQEILQRHTKHEIAKESLLRKNYAANKHEIS